jgi:hypothetical protein
MDASALMLLHHFSLILSPFFLSLPLPLPLKTGGASGNPVSDWIGEDGDQVLQAEVQGG